MPGMQDAGAQTTKNMAFELTGSLLTVVHNSNPPSDREWSEYVVLTARMLDEAETSSSKARQLVITSGGGPSLLQRKALYDAARKRTCQVAVVSSNAFVRVIVTAIRVVNPLVQSFHPDHTGEAFRFLQITDTRAASRRIEQLRAQVSEGRTTSIAR